MKDGLTLGCRQAVKARDFDSRIVGSNPATPATFFDPLAQSVEHLTFNQGVPGSNPGRVTIFFCAGVAELADALDLGSNTLGCVSSSLFARTTNFNPFGVEKCDFPFAADAAAISLRETGKLMSPRFTGRIKTEYAGIV